MWLRIIVLGLVLAIIIYGLRAIRRNINDYITKDDEEKLRRDRADRDRGQVVDLKRDPEDGVFRPNGDKKDKSDQDKDA